MNVLIVICDLLHKIVFGSLRAVLGHCVFVSIFFAAYTLCSALPHDHYMADSILHFAASCLGENCNPEMNAHRKWNLSVGQCLHSINVSDIITLLLLLLP